MDTAKYSGIHRGAVFPKYADVEFQLVVLEGWPFSS